MRRSLFAAALVIAGVASAKALIPYERFTLANGLQVIVHEDHKAPIVAVQVVYRVGARDEPQGKTGFAHLFEHLLFKGSENFHGDFYQTLDNVGASNTNAVTTQDTTTYFETVPTPALELALWLESERMGHFLGTITQALLDTERGVVQNEKRERESESSSLLDTEEMAGVFPQGHPYSRPVLGSMDDLNAASVQDVRNWFTEFYGASNAILVLSGDIDTATARVLTGKYFGDAPPGAPVHRVTAWVPERALNKHEIMQGPMAQTYVQWSWAVPGPQTRDYTMLSIAAAVLRDPIQSRLRDVLVNKRKLATAIGVSLTAHEIASVFTIAVDLKAGEDLSELEQAVDTELRSFLREGPTQQELLRSRNDLDALELWGLQSVTQKGTVLANAAAFTGDPGFNDRSIRWTREASRQEVLAATRRWLSRGYFQLTAVPFGEPHSITASISRQVMPPVEDDLILKLPRMQEATLSNGMKLVLAERHEVPAVRMSMVFAGAGRNADAGGKFGRSVTTFALMKNGPAGLTKKQYSVRLQELHASIGIGVALRDASSGLTVLKKYLPEALPLWQRALRQPAFRPDDIERWRKGELDGIEGSSNDPDSVGSKTMAAVIYPPGHPYTTVWNISEAVNELRKKDFEDAHAQWVRPDVAKLFVVGDTTLAELVPQLEKTFSKWKAPVTPLPVLNLVPIAPVPTHARFILVDWPAELQTRIFAGRLVPGADHEESHWLKAANDFMGGDTTSRLGQRIRVEKGWSYGVTSALDGNLGQQYWGLSTRVQVDKTVEAIAEIVSVIEDFNGPHPGTSEELSRYVKGVTRSLPGAFEDAGAVLNAMVLSNAYGHPCDWAEGTKQRLDAIRLEDVNRVGREYFKPQSLTWVLVGDISRFEGELRTLGMGTVEVWDHNGHRIH